MPEQLSIQFTEPTVVKYRHCNIGVSHWLTPDGTGHFLRRTHPKNDTLHKSSTAGERTLLFRPNDNPLFQRYKYLNTARLTGKEDISFACVAVLSELAFLNVSDNGVQVRPRNYGDLSPLFELAENKALPASKYAKEALFVHYSAETRFSLDNPNLAEYSVFVNFALAFEGNERAQVLLSLGEVVTKVKDPLGRAQQALLDIKKQSGKTIAELLAECTAKE